MDEPKIIPIEPASTHPALEPAIQGQVNGVITGLTALARDWESLQAVALLHSDRLDGQARRIYALETVVAILANQLDGLRAAGKL